MEDKFYQQYKDKVYARLSELNKESLPPTWWDSVIKYYYNLGYSEERTVRIILETMEK
jgi:hypothetical protein